MKRRRLIILGIASTAGVVLAWLLVGLWIPRWTWEANANRGLWGDAFGAVSALFTGLAFAGLVLTLYFQSRELDEQRRDEAAAREDSRRIQEVSAEQLDQLRRQRFEQTFFQMLSLLDRSVESMRFRALAGPGWVGGRSGLAQVIGQLVGAMPVAPNEDDEVSQEDVSRAFGDWFEQHGPGLGQYLRLLSETLWMVDELPEDDRPFRYATILGTHLSRNELLLAFYLTMSEEVEPFDLLAQMSVKHGLFINLAHELSDERYAGHTQVWHSVATERWGKQGYSFDAEYP